MHGGQHGSLHWVDEGDQTVYGLKYVLEMAFNSWNLTTLGGTLWRVVGQSQLLFVVHALFRIVHLHVVLVW